MTDKERLIELIKQGNGGYDFNSLEKIADHLIANGVIVLSCKVGDVVFQTDGVRIYELEIFDIYLYKNKPYYETESIDFDGDAIGKSVFLTKEEAEQALKEGAEE